MAVKITRAELDTLTQDEKLTLKAFTESCAKYLATGKANAKAFADKVNERTNVKS